MSFASVDKSKLNIKYIHLTIMLLLSFSGWVLPTFGQITPMGMKVLGVFLGTIYGWITLSLGWISLLSFVLLAMTGYMSVDAAFSSGIGNIVVIRILVCFVIAGIIEISDLGKVILSKCMKINGVAEHPWLLVAMLMIAAALIALFGDAIAATFLVWAVIQNIADINGCEEKNRFIAFLIGSAVIVPQMAMMCLPFKPTALAFYGFFENANLGIEIPMIPFIIYTLTIATLFVVIFFILAKVILKLDVNSIKISARTLKELTDMEVTSDHKKGIFLMAFLFICLLVPGILPAEWAITKLFSTWGLLGTMSIVIAIAQIMTNSKGQVYAPLPKISQSIGWDMIWLMAVTFPLATALESEECGVMATVLEFVMPMLSDMNPTVFIIICTVACASLTQVVHNIILGVMFMPICAQLIIPMGGNPVVLWFGMYFALAAAYGTPAASVAGAMVFGHKRIYGMEGYYIGFLFMIAVILVVVAIGIPLGNIMF